MDGLQLFSRHRVLARHPRGHVPHGRHAEPDLVLRDVPDQGQQPARADDKRLADEPDDAGSPACRRGGSEVAPRVRAERTAGDLGSLETQPRGHDGSSVGCDVQGTRASQRVVRGNQMGASA